MVPGINVSWHILHVCCLSAVKSVIIECLNLLHYQHECQVTEIVHSRKLLNVPTSVLC